MEYITAKEAAMKWSILNAEYMCSVNKGVLKEFSVSARHGLFPKTLRSLLML